MDRQNKNSSLIFSLFSGICPKSRHSHRVGEGGHGIAVEVWRSFGGATTGADDRHGGRVVAIGLKCVSRLCTLVLAAQLSRGRHRRESERFNLTGNRFGARSAPDGDRIPRSAEPGNEEDFPNGH
jgi:hypothetical protein